MKATLDRFSLFLPWLALALLLAGAIVTWTTGRFELLNNLLLAGGGLLLLLFAIVQPDQVRRLLSGRSTRYGLSTFLSILFFLAIAVILYAIAYQNNNWRYDTTETGQFTPPAEILELLTELDQPIHVIGFYTLPMVTSGQQARAEQLLATMTAVTRQLTYEFQDPEINPQLAQRYELNFPGTLVFISGEGDGQVFSKSNTLADRDIYAALLKVINPRDKKLYFLTGHGEPAIDDFGATGLATTISLLEDSGFTVDSLNLNVTGDVPDDAAVVAIVDPQVPLQPAEAEALQRYLAAGGGAFFARDVADYASPRLAGVPLPALLRDDWGVTLRQDVIIEQVFAQAGSALDIAFLGASYGSGPITNELSRYGTVFNFARSVATEPVDGVTAINLVMTSDNSWGETDLEALGAGLVRQDPDDTAGPLAVGVSAENVTTGARLVVFGDADFLGNQAILQLGNSLLLSNALNWLADDELSISLTPRQTVQRQLVIPQERLNLLVVTGLCLGPGLMALVGGLVWYSRRQRR